MPPTGNVTIVYLDSTGATQTLSNVNRGQLVFNPAGIIFTDGTQYFFEPWSRILEVISDMPLNTMFTPF